MFASNRWWLQYTHWVDILCLTSFAKHLMYCFSHPITDAQISKDFNIWSKHSLYTQLISFYFTYITYCWKQTYTENIVSLVNWYSHIRKILKISLTVPGVIIINRMCHIFRWLVKLPMNSTLVSEKPAQVRFCWLTRWPWLWAKQTSSKWWL